MKEPQLALLLLIVVSVQINVEATTRLSTHNEWQLAMAIMAITYTKPLSRLYIQVQIKTFTKHDVRSRNGSVH